MVKSYYFFPMDLCLLCTSSQRKGKLNSIVGNILSLHVFQKFGLPLRTKIHFFFLVTRQSNVEMCLDVWIWTTLTQKMWCKLHIKDRMQWFAIHFGSIFNCIGHKDKMFNVTLIESFQGGPDGWLARHTHAHVQRPCIHHNSPGFESKDKIFLNKSGNIPFF